MQGKAGVVAAQGHGVAGAQNSEFFHWSFPLYSKFPDSSGPEHGSGVQLYCTTPGTLWASFTQKRPRLRKREPGPDERRFSDQADSQGFTESTSF